MKSAPNMIAKYKSYTLVAYTKQDSELAPLAGGKVMLNSIVENGHGHQMNTSKTDSSVEQLADQRWDQMTAKSGLCAAGVLCTFLLRQNAYYLLRSRGYSYYRQQRQLLKSRFHWTTSFACKWSGSCSSS